eukprot:jgi/Ulvmu1/7591/UM038_0014.1
MNEVQNLVEQCRFSEIADVLERSDSPLDCQNEDIDLWLLLILSHVMNHKCPHARFACKRAPEAVQRHQEFKLAFKLVQYVWNREYSDVWRVLQSDTWRSERAELLGAVAAALRQQVAASIGSAYSCIRVNTACGLLGVSPDDFVADCQRKDYWHVDPETGFVRIQQDAAKPVTAVELAEIERITDHMISLA